MGRVPIGAALGTCPIQVLAIWLFFGTNNWIKADGADAVVLQPKGRIGENTTAPNPYMIYTTRGGKAPLFKVQCSDPYDEVMSDLYDDFGNLLCGIVSAFFFVCFAAFAATRCYVVHMYRAAELQKLGDESGAGDTTEMRDLGRGAPQGVRAEVPV